ncbi:uncharacterized protein BKCO1_2800030 [Diplodia corticola]|uniref:Non-reducing end beta-L-arabinofuranosidase-like GH127 catalytic domain-containing protein n=1 Tax=Diplodia corticola TaxID=236234 RepID=A0A1J9RZ96_9PEZI|nr:uncharacterized protein BKCO1_2800030 [Diplodia corticola]OJD33671.1 hypothetical protein BKCO1_2800030 [Diplodia corticola]
MSSATLVPMKYELFPLGSIKPEGWFRDQLRLCGQGLGGKLFHFYRFVKNSTWLGGTWEYTPLNEAAPYWYNYMVPLAFSFDESIDAPLARELRAQAEQFLHYTLDHQSPEGWLGPETTRETRGIWARCLLLQGLMNHALADTTKREVIINGILKFVALVESMLQRDYEGYLPKDGDEFDKQWFGVARAHELSTTLQWLYDEPEAAEQRASIWHVMEMLWDGSRLAKRDWTVFFTKENFPQMPSVKHQSPNFQHGVNVAQGLRYPAQLYRMHPSSRLFRLSKQAVARAFQFHGTPAGSLSSDEYVGGLSPQRGAELCCSVELIFSLSYLHRLFGDNDFADRAELAAYNSLPAAIQSDWWSHQYVTQTNQPWAQELRLEENERTPFYDVCRYANVFGLEPEFPCCTVNHPTAYPKMLMNSFLRLTPEPRGRALVAVLHAYLIPSKLSIDGITISCESNYPFAPCAMLYSISTDQPFDFFIRVPRWATALSSIEIRDAQAGSSRLYKTFASNVEDAALAGLHRVQIPAGGEYKVAVTLHADIRVEYHADKSVSISYGPLLYAYPIEYSVTTRPPRNYKDQVSDCPELDATAAGEADQGWQSKVWDHDLLPTSAWGIAIDPGQKMKLVFSDPWLDGKRERIRELPNPIWDAGASPVYIEVTAVAVDWPVRNGTAAEPSAVDASSTRGKPFRAKLAPFGTAKLHMAQFPVVDL